MTPPRWPPTGHDPRAQRAPPPAEIGESTQCPRCGTENRPGLAFCRNCGQRLVAAGLAPTVERLGAPEGTLACPRCGTHNRAGVAFCQNCGANLPPAATPGYVPPPRRSRRTGRGGRAGRCSRRRGPRPGRAPHRCAGDRRRLAAAIRIRRHLALRARLRRRWLRGRLLDRLPGRARAASPISRTSASPARRRSWSRCSSCWRSRASCGPVPARSSRSGSPSRSSGPSAWPRCSWCRGARPMGGPITELLRALTPGGIIFFLASLIVLIGDADALRTELTEHGEPLLRQLRHRGRRRCGVLPVVRPADRRLRG